VLHKQIEPTHNKAKVSTECSSHPTVNNPGLIIKYYEALGRVFGRRNIALCPSGWSCWPWHGTSTGPSGKSVSFPMPMSFFGQRGAKKSNSKWTHVRNV